MQVKLGKIAWVSNTKYVILKQPIIAQPCDSYSPILAIARFIVKNFPKVLPPTFYPDQQIRNEINNYNEKHLGTTHTCNLILFEPWCDYLVSLLEENFAYRESKQNQESNQKQDILYILGLCDESYIDTLQQTNRQLFSEGLIKKPICNDYKNSTEKTEKIILTEKRKNYLQILRQVEGLDIDIDLASKIQQTIGLVNFATSQLRTNPLIPKIHLRGLIAGIWYRNHHSWKVFYILKQQYPTEQQLATIDALILSGSSHSVNDCIPEVQKFMKIMQQTLQTRKDTLKIWAVCFGHQFIAKLFGGRVTKKKWIGGIQEVQFDNKNLLNYSFFTPILSSGKKMFQISQFHSDYVEIIPQQFRIISSSVHCQVQGMINKNGNILTLQFHPQYLVDYAKDFEKRTKLYYQQKKGQAISACLGTKTTSNQVEHWGSVDIVRKMIQSFLQ